MTEMSAVAKILIVFLAVLGGSRLRLPLGIALIAGGCLLDLWAGRGTAGLTADLLTAVRRPDLWLLVLNITLIMEFGRFMAEPANSGTIVTAARHWSGRRGRAAGLILIPASIGLVPMPGGALFSAPLVEQSLEDAGNPPAWKAAVNYWFRHVLEYWWPLYPVVIVTLSIFTLDTWEFMVLQIPFTGVSLLAGYVFLLHRHLPEPPEITGPKTGTSSLSTVLCPILIIVAATLLLPPVAGHLVPAAGPAVRKLLAMLAGLVVSLWLIRSGTRTERRLFTGLLTKKTGNVVVTLAGVLIFQTLLERSGLLPLAGRELAAGRAPLPLVVALLPFLAGLVTGIAIGFAGTAFPIVVGFLGTGDGSLTPMASLVLAFSMGYAGMMLSPVHLCLVLTREYFTATLPATYRFLLPCILSVMAFGAGLYYLLGMAGL